MLKSKDCLCAFRLKFLNGQRSAKLKRYCKILQEHVFAVSEQHPYHHCSFRTSVYIVFLQHRSKRHVSVIKLSTFWREKQLHTDSKNLTTIHKISWELQPFAQRVATVSTLWFEDRPCSCEWWTEIATFTSINRTFSSFCDILTFLMICFPWNIVRQEISEVLCFFFTFVYRVCKIWGLHSRAPASFRFDCILLRESRILLFVCVGEPKVFIAT